jgi:N-acetylated-alpha-linked acidic dipeptidase
LLVEVSRTLAAPSGKTLYDEWKVSRQAELHVAEPVLDSELANTRIGSGSDHTVFLNYLGIPTIELTFAGPYGVYHSAYDDFYWMDHFGDPGYRYHALMSQLWGTTALRLANAEILPYDFESYGTNIRKFVADLDAATHVSGQLTLAPVLQRVAEFQAAGHGLNHSRSLALASGHLNATASRVNQELMQIERNWCNAQGIPGRPWFKHTIYGTRSTYAHLELPGLAEAAEAGDWKRATEQVKILEDELAKNSTLLRRAKQWLDSSLEVPEQ